MIIGGIDPSVGDILESNHWGLYTHGRLGEICRSPVSLLVVNLTNFFSKVVQGAITAGFHGAKLEEKVSTVLVKGYKPGDHPDGTIKHM